MGRGRSPERPRPVRPFFEVEPMEPHHPKRRARGKSQVLSQSDSGASSGVSELTQLALWMAASLAGMVTALLLARRPFFESLMRSVGNSSGTGTGAAAKARGPATPRRAGRRPSAEESLPM